MSSKSLITPGGIATATAYRFPGGRTRRSSPLEGSQPGVVSAMGGHLLVAHHPWRDRNYAHSSAGAPHRMRRSSPLEGSQRRHGVLKRSRGDGRSSPLEGSQLVADELAKRGDLARRSSPLEGSQQDEDGRPRAPFQGRSSPLEGSQPVQITRQHHAVAVAHHPWRDRNSLRLVGGRGGPPSRSSPLEGSQHSGTRWPRPGKLRSLITPGGIATAWWSG
mgnify:CR=1 FL=1